MSNEIVSSNVFAVSNYQEATNIAKSLSLSNMLPQTYSGNIGNCLIALDIANRMGMSPLMVAQNLYIVKGKPGWSGSFLIATINISGKFKSSLKFKFDGAKDNLSCYAYATDFDGETLRGATITMEMVKREGWGAKWQTMPEQMMMYRAAAFFSRVYCPEVALGLQTVEELEDVKGVEVITESDEKTTLKDILKRKQNPIITTETKIEEGIICNEETGEVIENKENEQQSTLFETETEKPDHTLMWSKVKSSIKSSGIKDVKAFSDFAKIDTNDRIEHFYKNPTELINKISEFIAKG